MELVKIHSDYIIETDNKNFITSAQKALIESINIEGNLDLSIYAKIESPEFTGTPTIKDKGNILSESSLLNGGYF